MKQVISLALYLGVIPVSYRSVTVAMAMLAVVAILWLIPPKQVLEMTRT
jgi:hypothetical protein